MGEGRKGEGLLCLSGGGGGLRLAGRKEGEPGPAKRLKAKPSGAHKDDLRTRLGNLKTDWPWWQRG